MTLCEHHGTVEISHMTQHPIGNWALVPPVENIFHQCVFQRICDVFKLPDDIQNEGKDLLFNCTVLFNSIIHFYPIIISK